MARSCGLRIGPRRFELVVLDGSPKKHRITAFRTGEFPRDADDPVGAAVSVLKEAAKTASIPGDNVRLVIDSGLGAFRTLKLPFDDDSKIESVLKFEIEGQFPQWSIDDVVVDWLKLDSIEKETNLLVAAVPKVDVSAVLALCEQASIEPLETELETTAMINAALSADICHIDDAQVLVHIGETSTSVVVMDSGQVRSMRAIHVGALSWELAAGGDEAAEAPDAGAEEGASDADAFAQAPTDPEAVRKHLQQIVTRLQRELGRTLSGARTINEIDAIYVCGTELPDLVGSTVMDVPVYVLDVFEEDGGQPADGTAPLVVAYGAALAAIGGGHVEARLRREELRFAGKFEKLELPLAIAALLLVTWLSVFNIFEKHQFDLRTREVDAWLMSTLNYMEGDPAQGHRGRLEFMNKLTDIQDVVDEIRAEHRTDDEGNPVEQTVAPMDRLLDLEALLMAGGPAHAHRGRHGARGHAAALGAARHDARRGAARRARQGPDRTLLDSTDRVRLSTPVDEPARHGRGHARPDVLRRQLPRCGREPRSLPGSAARPRMGLRRRQDVATRRGRGGVHRPLQDPARCEPVRARGGLIMNLARWIMLFSVLGSAYLGWQGWDYHTQRKQLELDLNGEVQDIAEQLMVLSVEHSSLYKELQSEGLAGPQATIKTYISKRAQLPDVRLGNVVVQPREQRLKNATDIVSTIEPAEKKRGVQRVSIANFLHFLEKDSHRVKVTRIKMVPDQRLREHEISNDSWLWEAQVTTREKNDVSG